MAVFTDAGSFAQKKPNAGYAAGSPRASVPELSRPERVSHVTAITHTIEAEIIPRLLLISNDDRADPGTALARRASGPANRRSICEADVALFADSTLTRSVRECILLADLIHRQGVPLGALFLHLLAPAARRLGDIWMEDLCSFMDVTIALGTVQQVFRHFSQNFLSEGFDPQPLEAVLVPAPGEQHTFGLFVLETFLTRAGWRVSALPTYDAGAMRALLSSGAVPLVCFSASDERHLDALSREITSIKLAARKQAPLVMVGGVAFHDRPELVAAVGAEATARDAAEAVTIARSLVAQGVRNLPLRTN